MKWDEIKKQNLMFCMINVLVFLAIFSIDSMFPYVIDDISYASDYNGSSISEAFGYSLQSIVKFFYGWSGRMIGNYFAFLMVVLPKVVYNVLNAFVFIVLGNTIYHYVILTEGVKTKPIKDSLLLGFVFLGLWIFVPQFGMVVIWTNASTIYHWTLTILLLFMYPYWWEYICGSSKKSVEMRERKTVNRILEAWGMFILGILGGNSMEPVAGTAFLAFIGYVIWKLRKKIAFNTWEISGMLGFIVGFLVILLAPGQAVRAAVVQKEIGDIPFWKDYAIRVARETYYTFKYMTPLLGIALALVLISWRVKWFEMQNGKNDKCDLARLKEIIASEKYALLFVIFALLSIYAMTLSIAFAIRIFLNPTVLFLISIGISMKSILNNIRIRAIVVPALKVLATFLVVFVMTQYITAMLEMKQTGEPFRKDVYYVSSEFSEGLIK